MTVSQKVSVSLLIAVVLFAGFAALAFTGLFQLVEARFYNPTIAKGLERELAADAAVTGDYFTELENRFAAELASGEVKRSFLPNQSAQDVFERSKRFGLLMEAVSGLQSVRFVDVAGKRIHYSTSRGDELRRDKLSVSYRNYGEAAGDLPFDALSVAEGGVPRLVVDAAGDRFIFAFPFLDSFEVYKGTAIFTVSVRGLAERLTSEGRLRVGEDLAPVGEPSGVVSGLPRVGREDLLSAVAQVWSDGTFGPTPLATGSSGSSFALISSKTSGGIITGRLVSESVFAFPPAMKGILLVSFFLTVYLVVFLLFNLRQDSLTVIRDRIKRFQIALMEEYYDRKGDLDWNRWKRELEQRRDEVRAELKRDLHGSVPKRLKADVDELIDKSWDELLTAIGGRMTAPVTAQLDEGKLQDILGRVMALAPTAAPVAAPAAPQAKPKKSAAKPSPAPKPIAPVEEAEAEEDLEEVAEAEAVEDLEEIAEAEAEEELEEVAEAEAEEDLEEVAEAEAVEDLEEIAEAEAEEDLEEIAEAEAEEELEEVSEAEAEEELEEIAEAEAVEDLEEIAEAESAEDVEEIAEAEAEEDVEEVAEAEAEEDLEELAEAETSAELEELAEVEAVEDLEEIAEVEEIEELEEIEAAETIEISMEDFDDKAPSSAELDRIARDIEFAPMPEIEGEIELPDMKVVSPFEELLSELESEDALVEPGDWEVEGLLTEDGLVDEIATLEPLESIAEPYRLFSASGGYIESLELMGDAEEEAPSDLLAEEEEVIELLDGVPYVAATAGESFSNVEQFDPDLGQLVKSVLDHSRP